MSKQLFVSSHVPPGETKGLLGKPYYSYAFAAEGYFEALNKLELPTKFIPTPERVTAKSWSKFYSEPGAENFHLMFKNFRSIRPVRWAHNIGLVYWEFENISGPEAAGENPFRDQIRMLKACDELWVASEHTKRVFEKKGIDNTHVIPSPVRRYEWQAESEREEAFRRVMKLPSISLSDGAGPNSRPKVTALGFQSAVRKRADSTMYFSMCNPLDPRKQLKQLVRAFAQFNAAHPDTFLVIKISVDPERFPISKLASTFLPERLLTTVHDRVVCENIIFINSFVEPYELATLHDMSDFHISPTRGEGQNLPIQEAMLSGTPVIVPNHTSMLDYLVDGQFIPIAFKKNFAPLGHEPHYHVHDRPVWNESRTHDILEALLTSYEMPIDARTKMGKHGQAQIKNSYSASVVAQKMAGRLGVKL